MNVMDEILVNQQSNEIRMKGIKGLCTTGCRLNNIYQEILIDTGAAYNVIAQDTIQSEIFPCSTQLRAANQTGLEVVGVTFLHFELADIKSDQGTLEFAVNVCAEDESNLVRMESNFQYKKIENEINLLNTLELNEENMNGNAIPFIVVKELSVPVLLGYPSIRSLELVFDAANNCIIQGSRRFSTRDLNDSFVFAAVRTVIESGTSQRVKIYGNIRNNVLLKDIIPLPAVGVVEGVLCEAIDQEYSIFVNNLSKESIIIEQDTPLASFSICELEDEVIAEGNTKIEQGKIEVEFDEKSLLKNLLSRIDKRENY
jgi:hypothetical protein